MRLFSKLFSKKALPPQQPQQNPLQNLCDVIYRYAGSNAAAPKKYGEGLNARAALRNFIVFRCVNKIASSVQSVPWEVQIDPDASAESQKAAVGKRQDLQDLLDKPCNFTGSELRYWLAAVFALFGNAPLKAGVYNGSINALYPLRPDRIGLKTDKYGNINSYEYGDTDIAQSILPKNKAVAANGNISEAFAFEIKKPDIFLDPGKAINALNVMGIPLEIIDNLMERATDLSNGTPNLKHIIFSKNALPNNISKGIEEEIKARQGGAAAAAENDGFLLLSGVDLGILDIKDGLDDLHSKIPLDDMSRTVAGLFGIPVALLGFSSQDGSKYANNYGESRLSFWEDTLIPEYLLPIETSLTENICPLGLRIRFDKENIPALFAKRIEAAQQLEKISFLTNDEKRDICGYEKLNTEQNTAAKAAKKAN